MKAFRILSCLLLSSLGIIVYGQGASLTVAVRDRQLVADYSVSARGKDFRTWKRVTAETAENGRVHFHTNSFVELATGMHYLENGQWRESNDEIEIVAGGAAAQRGAFKVEFAANINSAEAIKLVTSDGKHFRSHILGLAYTDVATRQSVLIAELKDSIGVVVGRNQVLYRDAFTDVKADVRYTYTRAGFEQDIILRENPPSPDAYGLNSETARLEIFTEFIDPPQPDKEVTQLPSGIQDEVLNFRGSRMGHGRAFPLEVGGIDRLKSVPVGKTWERRDNRQFLIEAVPYFQVQQPLSGLPQAAAVTKEKLERVKRLAGRVQESGERFARYFPPAPMPPASKKEVQLSANIAIPESKGFVLDYELMGSGTLRLESDKTYFVSDAVAVESLTIEGGTVVKYAPNAYIDVMGNVDCLTGPYQPAIFTAKDDNSIGQLIPGSTGVPSGYYANVGLYVNSSASLHDLRISHASLGLVAVAEANLQNIQFTFCDSAVEVDVPTVTADNVLFYRSGSAFVGGAGSAVVGRHVTAHQCSQFADANLSLFLTNSLLVNVTNWGTTTHLTEAVVITTDESTFQTVGSGAHYLADNSVHRSAGVNTIPASLAAALKTLTTFPPTIISPANRLYTESATWGIQAGRDTDAPDLGYHYSPIDYAVARVYLENATVRLAPGTVVAGFNPGASADYGIAIGSGGKLLVEGTADARAIVTHYSTVQELANNTWAGPIAGLLYTWGGVAVAPELRCRFTDVSVSGADMYSVYGFSGMTWRFNDCQFNGGFLNDWWGPALIFTNCIFNRTYLSVVLEDTSINRFHNCTFYGGTWETYFGANNTVSFSDNLFAGTQILAYSDIPSSSIGYTTNCIGRLLTSNASDRTVDILNFETGPYGRFYLPPNSVFRDAGSQSAAAAGLFHYTTTTNQAKEGNGTVDIGAHFVAAADVGSGTFAAIDMDRDRAADYVEDANGNGVKNDGETDVALSFTDGDQPDFQHYDSTGPRIHITNGVPGTLTRPVLQLQGYSEKPLKSISYTLFTNGVIASADEGHVRRQHFDPVAWQLTTNWFQIYDLELTPGANRVSVQFTDLADNVVPVEFEYNLDYSGVVNGPQVVSVWPANGAVIAADSVTVRGYMDDPTAEIHARITAPEMTVTEVVGEVERDGLFWLDNLPLGAGNNSVTLLMTNAAGRTSSQSFTVVGSSVRLNINPVTESTAAQKYVPVSGSISAAGYTVWVNGSRATMNWDLTWTVPQAFVNEGGTATFEAVAIPNSENGGSGTPPSGDALPSNVTATNPAAPGSLAKREDVEKNARIRVSSYDANGTSIPDVWSPCVEGIDRPSGSFTAYWAQDFGGWRLDYSEGENCDTGQNPPQVIYAHYAQHLLYRPDGSWVVSEALNGGDWSEWGNTCVSCSFIDRPYEPWEVRDTEQRIDNLGTGLMSTVKNKAHTRVELLTGGRARVNRQNLFALNVSVINGQGGNVPPSQVQIRGQTVGNDGKLYLALRDNEAVDVTPTVNLNHYRYAVTPKKHKITIIANGEPLKPDALSTYANYSVGEKIVFTTVATPALSGIQTESRKWNFSGTHVNAYRYFDPNLGGRYELTCYPQKWIDLHQPGSASASKEYVINPDILTELETGAWWYDKGTVRARCGMSWEFQNGKAVSLVAVGQLRIWKPTVTVSPAASGAVLLAPNEDNPGRLKCSFGVPIFISSPFPGEADTTQLILADRAADPSLGLPACELGTDGEYMVDNGEFYGPRIPIVVNEPPQYISWVDEPFQPGYSYIRADDSFQTFIRFKPAGSGNIWVTIGKFEWDWHGTADKFSGTWIIRRQSVDGPRANLSSNEFPKWEHQLSNLSLSFCTP